jgi:hypothetical protein
MQRDSVANIRGQFVQSVTFSNHRQIEALRDVFGLATKDSYLNVSPHPNEPRSYSIAAQRQPIDQACLEIPFSVRNNHIPIFEYMVVWERENDG